MTSHPVNWLAGVPFTVVMGLVYGYIPYMILPLYGFLDRIDQSILEAGRDLGANPLPDVRTGDRAPVRAGHPGQPGDRLLADVRGDYYTNNLPRVPRRRRCSGTYWTTPWSRPVREPEAAVLVLFLAFALFLPMLYYMRETNRAQEEQ